MKKILFFLVICFASFRVEAQSPLYVNLKQLILQSHPELQLDDRLIALNVWSMEDQESREANKSFEKTFSVYEHALLKGGRKGIVVVCFNKENLPGNAVITLSKDGITKIISYKISDLKELDPKIKNVVLDAEGRQVYSNLSPDVIFESIHHLITR